MLGECVEVAFWGRCCERVFVVVLEPLFHFGLSAFVSLRERIFYHGCQAYWTATIKQCVSFVKWNIDAKCRGVRNTAVS